MESKGSPGTRIEKPKGMGIDQGKLIYRSRGLVKNKDMRQISIVKIYVQS